VSGKSSDRTEVRYALPERESVGRTDEVMLKLMEKKELQV
jgi:hypothetical protein